ncbi:polysaccharide deacetylase family protein [Verrucomicrobiota bacterium]
MKLPFQERKTVWRGIIDLCTGCYPGFLFGGRLAEILPVFHFHEVTEAYLEPYLSYLVDNGYRTVTSEAVGRFVRDGISPGNKTVVLCFDDAWSSLWTVVGPLLKKYGLTAITYAIPCYIKDIENKRPTIGDDSISPDSADQSDVPFATWNELSALEGQGLVDVQAHTYSHAQMFSSPDVVGFVTPDTDTHILCRPILRAGVNPVFASDQMLGCPIYFHRSRMSDAVRFVDDESVRSACIEKVRREGNAVFFERCEWERELRSIVQEGKGCFESTQEQTRALREELSSAKEILEHKLKKRISQVCFPWAVCGQLAEQLVRETGYESAVADMLFGKRFVAAKSNQYRIMRLKHQFIYCLPGKGRKWFLSARINK